MTYAQLQASCKTYDDVDFHANLYWGDGQSRALTVPASSISDPMEAV